MKKLISGLLMLAILSIVPVLTGCEENEYKMHEEKTTTETRTNTVVQ